MKYYKITNSLDLKEIGKYPQIEEVKYSNSISFEDPLFIDNIGYKKIDFVPVTPIGILNKGAKLTDYLSSPSIGYSNKLLINSRFKKILDRLDIGNFQAFEAKIETYKKDVFSYWIINPIHFNYKDIDFKKSEIFLLKDLFLKEKKINILTLESFKSEKKRIKDIGYPYQFYIEKIFFNKTSDKDFIIIDNVNGGIGYYVSENLKNNIQNNNLTGIEFEEL